MTLPLFGYPSVHDISRLEADARVLDAGTHGAFVCTEISFHAKDGRSARMSIHAPTDTADKFKRLAAAINQIFGDDATLTQRAG